MALGTESATRYVVSSGESSLTVEARSTLHPVRAIGIGLSGYVAAGWNADGSLASTPQPAMHVEFPIDQISSGNALQDREMRKLVDATRFPKAAADLRSLELLSPPNRYKASGDITFVGRKRAYDGELTISGDGESLTVDGDVRLDIRDFGLKPPNLLILKVDPVLSIRLRLVARKAA
jgi:polyisoprenoid-binding protein YceI